MADNDAGSNPLFSWPSLVALTALVGGVLWFQTPLRSSRPGEASRPGTKVLGEQNIEARLWQDPLGAAAQAGQAGGAEASEKAIFQGSGSYSFTEFVTRFEEHSSKPTSPPGSPTNVLILQVMLSGGPYVEDTESRLRSRYAVLSALGMAGYVPDDAEHLGCFHVVWSTPPACLCTDEETGVPFPVPFEWFHPGEFPKPLGAGYAAVLVLWLNADAFTQQPMARLAQFVACFRANHKNDSQLQFKILDPRLQEMLEPGADLGVDSVYCQMTNSTAKLQSGLTNVEVYSSWSTTADALLGERAEEPRREAVRRQFAQWGLQFHNVTCTDDELARKLIGELALRGVDLAQTNASVALISEWDTFYGRALPLTFAAALESHTHGAHFARAVECLETNREAWPPNLCRFTYLRGIDGLLPGTSPPPVETEKEKDPTKDIQKLERPVGASQLDYMPRLARELKEREREDAENHQPLRAIGVLGSDVYDKLLLLQSLQKLFPNVIFFTTDLDARLTHPAELAWSRNLLVASSFDLELGEKLQGAVPPFRDTYQTAQFLACLAALGHVQPEVLGRVQPRIFEVGRNGAYVLDTVPSELYAGRPPAISKSVKLWPFAVGLLALALVGCFNPSIMRVLRPVGHEEWRSRTRAFRGAGLVLAVCVGFTALVGQQHASPTGAPFSLVDGISIWPAEFLRLLGIGLSLFFIVRANAALTTSNHALAKEFMLPQKPATSESWRVWLLPSCWRHWLDANLCLWRTKQGPVDAAELWQHYLWLGQASNRCWRLLPAVVLYAILGTLLMVHFGQPLRPFRGPISDWVDLGLIAASGLALVVLMFFVVDTALLCRQFIQHLTQGPTAWPSELLKKYAAERNMARQHLDEWLDIRLLAERTKVVGQFIYYPFIVLLVLILARSPFFNHFDWPLSLILVFGINGAFALYCAVSLRQATEKARQQALKRLQQKLLHARGADHKLAVATLQLTIKEIKNTREGAFAPWSQQPFLHAILVPLGGTGLLTLAQYLFLR